MRKLMFLALLSLTAGAAFAQGPGLPNGKWWRKSEVVERLALSQDQQQKLDGIFRASAPQLIDLRGDVEKRSLELRGELDQPQLNRGDIQRLAAKLNDSRGRLFERELMMMVDMRSALSDEQWGRLRSAMADQEGPRGRGMRRGEQGQQPPPPRERRRP